MKDERQEYQYWLDDHGIIKKGRGKSQQFFKEKEVFVIAHNVGTLIEKLDRLPKEASVRGNAYIVRLIPLTEKELVKIANSWNKKKKQLEAGRKIDEHNALENLKQRASKLNMKVVPL